jgi:hypothetical protein|tara:strand:+ start:307 stop:492 length:186 start_codon:yes stop_codon:yes gene_type:complete
MSAAYTHNQIRINLDPEVAERLQILLITVANDNIGELESGDQDMLDIVIDRLEELLPRKDA